MNNYKYRARRFDGKEVKGKIEAPTKKQAAQMLADKRLEPLEINQYFSLYAKFDQIQINKVINDKTLVFLLKQLGALLDAGVRVYEAIEILASQQDNRFIRRILFDIYFQVAAGANLSDAMDAYPKEFPDMLRNLIRVGEKAGELEKIVNQSAEYFEKQLRIKSSIKSAMMLPVVYSILAGAVMIGMLIWVIPGYVSLFIGLDAELPTVTLLFVKLSDFMTNHALLFFGSLIGLLVSLYLIFFKTNGGKNFIDVFTLKIPIFGNIVQISNLSRIASTLAQLVQSGVHSLEAVDVTKGVIDNHIYKDILTQCSRNIRNGDGMSLAFANHWAVSPVVPKMIAIGEKSGELDQMLLNLSSFYDSDIDIKVENLKKSIEPILLVLIYAVVGSMIIAVMFPMFSLMSQY